MVKDEKDRWWSKSPRTCAWNRRTVSGAWVEDVPPAPYRAVTADLNRREAETIRSRREMAEPEVRETGGGFCSWSLASWHYWRCSPMSPTSSWTPLRRRR